MEDMLKYLVVLAIVMISNIALGMYNNIGLEKITFDKNKFINGIIKAVIIAGSFVGLTYCFTVVDLQSIGVDPTTVMLSAIIIYAGKSIKTLATILGVNISNNK